MKRFAAKCLLAVAILCAGLVSHIVWRVYRAQPAMDKAYSISPDQIYLFIGSSDVGCSITEDAMHSNKVLWVSSCGPQFHAMKLLEFERRGKLKYVKAVIVPFTINNINHCSIKQMQISCVRQLPLCWRYMELLPVNWLDVVEGLYDHYTYQFVVSDMPMHPRVSITTRTKEWIRDFPDHENARETIFNPKLYTENYGMSKGWRDSLINAFLCMKSVCDRHHIRFIAIATPLLPIAREALPQEACECYDSIVAEVIRKGIEFVDFRADVPEKDFYDYWHLTDTCDYRDLFYKKLHLKFITNSAQGPTHSCL